MNKQIFIVDSFTDKPFRGNPAGIHLIDHPLDEDRMHAIARELNFSETAFVVMTPNQDDAGQAEFSIRYFSPIMEIPLCGHATLAASKVLFDQGHPSPLRFRTIEDRQLTIRQMGDRIEMEFSGLPT